MLIRRQLAKLISMNRSKGDYSSFNRVLNNFRDKYSGGRCFIVGTGPSINKTDLSLLDDEICFGVNTLYNIKSDCRYWVLCDIDVWKKKKDEVHQFVKSDYVFLAESIAVNLIRGGGGLWSRDILIRPLGSINVWDKVSGDITLGSFSGGTVVVHALQIAFFMGFKEVYLLGCDCDYSGVHHYDGSSTGDIGKAQGKMVKGDSSYVFNAYKKCREFFEKDNRCIYNATVGGKLEVFERRRLEAL